LTGIKLGGMKPPSADCDAPLLRYSRERAHFGKTIRGFNAGDAMAAGAWAGIKSAARINWTPPSGPLEDWRWVTLADAGAGCRRHTQYIANTKG